MSYQVILKPDEFFLAANAGLMRYVQNIKQDRHHRFKMPESDSFYNGIQGAVGEYAVAKAFRLYWAGKGEIRASDVLDFQVRTAPPYAKNLLLHEDDSDEDVFWFVKGQRLNYQVMGWCYGKEGKLPKYWTTEYNGKQIREPCYFVPETDLHIADLLHLDYSEPTEQEHQAYGHLR